MKRLLFTGCLGLCFLATTGCQTTNKFSLPGFAKSDAGPNVSAPSLAANQSGINTPLPNMQFPHTQIAGTRVPFPNVPGGNVQRPGINAPNTQLPNLQSPTTQLSSLQTPRIQSSKVQLPSVKFPKLNGSSAAGGTPSNADPQQVAAKSKASKWWPFGKKKSDESMDLSRYTASNIQYSNLPENRPAPGSYDVATAPAVNSTRSLPTARYSGPSQLTQQTIAPTQYGVPAAPTSYMPPPTPAYQAQAPMQSGSYQGSHTR